MLLSLSDDDVDIRSLDNIGHDDDEDDDQDGGAVQVSTVQSSTGTMEYHHLRENC